MPKNFSFNIDKHLVGTNARAGIISTPHGDIETPAFIPVGTKAALKSLTPEQLKQTGAQAILANAYHLYLRPGSNIIDKAGGLGKFMNWQGPTFTDSGGFQVMSLGEGFKKVIDMNGTEFNDSARKKDKLARINDDGVTFKSHLDGSFHRFNPEISMKIQHEIGADIIFSFDELTTLKHSRKYQEESLARRTHPWAERSLKAHKKLLKERRDKPYQALFGVIQGANYEDLRRDSARFMASLDFDGFGLGGALTKNNIGEIVSWMTDELPEDKPRHMLGISEPDDILACIENGADTFDCVSPARVARNGAMYSNYGRINITNRRFKDDFRPFDNNCKCYSCQNYSRAYLNHLFKTKETLAGTLATIHNEYFIIKFIRDARQSILDANFLEFKETWLNNYYKNK